MLKKIAADCFSKFWSGSLRLILPSALFLLYDFIAMFLFTEIFTSLITVFSTATGGGGDIRPLIILSPFSGQMKVGFPETKQNQEVLNSSKTDTDKKTECSNFKNRNLNQSPHLKASGRARNILAIQSSAPKYMPHPNFAKSLLIADHKIPSTQTKSLHV